MYTYCVCIYIYMYYTLYVYILSIYIIQCLHIYIYTLLSDTPTVDLPLTPFPPGSPRPGILDAELSRHGDLTSETFQVSNV